MALTAAQLEARRQTAEQEKIVRQGLRTAFQVSRALLREADRLWADGIDPSARVGQLAIDYIPGLLDAMQTATANARISAFVRAAPHVTKGMALAIGGLQGEALRFVEDRIAMSPQEIAAINTAYSAEAASLTGSIATDMEARVAAAVKEATEKGLHVREGSQLIGQAFADAGVVPSNAYLLETLYRTQTATAYAAGRWQANQDPAIQAILWGYEYSTAGDDRVRLEHEALDGVRLPKEDPRWASITPPNGWSCRCTLIEVYDTDDHEVITPPTDPLEIEGQVVVPGPGAQWKFHPLNAIGQTPNLGDTPAVGRQNKAPA